ncbi:hypothetical protein [Lysinibacillus fusiformis]|uniref:hypothetical protein n=1 Tax=Lysinibacillus fusiformis TaxID=28031 RepID=UPI0021C21A88|nr:hypothetical protein [Lysinibacillus fusiformis]UXJ71426.1 hypothetical protein N5069_23675 [Lysinibacillus fusiformis]
MNNKWSKLAIRSGVLVMLVSAVGGGVYLAEQKSEITEKKQVEVKDNPTDLYLQNVYGTYLKDVVPRWNELTDKRNMDYLKTKQLIGDWKDMLLSQEQTYVSLNQLLMQQVNTLEDFLKLTQQDETSEQRKSLRKLSADFTEGHQKVKETVLSILEEYKADYEVFSDGSIEYVFPQ